MPPPRKTTFQADWRTTFNFITPVEKDPHAAYCSLCKKSFSLSNMGRKAVESHINGLKHTQGLSATKGSVGIRLFTCSAAPNAADNVSDIFSAFLIWLSVLLGVLSSPNKSGL